MVWLALHERDQRAAAIAPFAKLKPVGDAELCPTAKTGPVAAHSQAPLLLLLACGLRRSIVSALLTQVPAVSVVEMMIE